MDGPVATLRPRSGIDIPVSLVRWRFDTAGGPGGQHANRAATRAEASLALDEVEGVDASVMARWRKRLGPVVRVSVGRSRSQARNRELALAELERRLAEALREERARRATAPSRGAKRRRVEAKRRRSETKARRRKPRFDD
ncbi:MAG: peptide chain release factor-like protein [Actinomycetota bacterium]